MLKWKHVNLWMRWSRSCCMWLRAEWAGLDLQFSSFLRFFTLRIKIAVCAVSVLWANKGCSSWQHLVGWAWHRINPIAHFEQLGCREARLPFVIRLKPQCVGEGEFNVEDLSLYTHLCQQLGRMLRCCNRPDTVTSVSEAFSIYLKGKS